MNGSVLSSLSKNDIKYVSALQIKKYRQEYGTFLVEGAKSVTELLNSDFEIEFIVLTETFYKENLALLNDYQINLKISTQDQLSKIGTLQTNDSCLAVVKTKENNFLYADNNEIVLVLDDIRDPGNLGAIIRVADWYGIKKVICSNTTTDWYNPKVIAASKGSFTRVTGFYTDLASYFQQIKAKNVFGTFLNGQNIHQLKLEKPSGYVVMGNESNGISKEVEHFVTNKITIPRFGNAESLNVGIATAIVLDNLHR